MKSKKKILSILLAVCMILMFVPMVALTAENLEKYLSADGNYIVPSGNTFYEGVN